MMLDFVIQVVQSIAGFIAIVSLIFFHTPGIVGAFAGYIIFAITAYSSFLWVAYVTAILWYGVGLKFEQLSVVIRTCAAAFRNAMLSFFIMMAGIIIGLLVCAVVDKDYNTYLLFMQKYIGMLLFVFQWWYLRLEYKIRLKDRLQVSTKSIDLMLAGGAMLSILFLVMGLRYI